MSMGLCPVVTDLINESNSDEVKYRAVVELLNIHTNTVVGRGFAVCSNKEKGKKFFDEYAIASMAQTRATGKAYRLPLGFLMKAAGYEATPAEEMDFNGNTPEIKVEPAPVQRKEEYGPDGKLRVNGQTYEEAKATAQQPTITNPMEQPTHDAEGNPINYASAKQKEEIIRLLNNPVITRQEKTKMLLNINKLDEERANQAIAKLKKVIEAREAECGAGGGASEPGE
nr:hypothetical protein [Adhaeribacter aquaticus]